MGKWKAEKGELLASIPKVALRLSHAHCGTNMHSHTRRGGVTCSLLHECAHRHTQTGAGAHETTKAFLLLFQDLSAEQISS